MRLKWNDQGLKTPLARARGLGAAGEGPGHWLHQRITAIANIPLVLWLVYSIVDMKGATYEAFTFWLAQPVNALLMIFVVVSTFYHAALGCQVITEDYVHHEGLKIAKLIGIRLFFFAAGTACIFSILKVALTAGAPEIGYG